MSTKAIREALEAFRTCKPVDRTTWHAQAIHELEAIEKAARDWYAEAMGKVTGLPSDAFAPFERIALETAPKT